MRVMGSSIGRKAKLSIKEISVEIKLQAWDSLNIQTVATTRASSKMGKGQAMDNFIRLHRMIFLLQNYLINILVLG